MLIFLYTDIEGSTQLWEKHGEIMNAVLDRHDEILLQCLHQCNGQHVKNTGDGLLAVFEAGEGQPLACAIAMQNRLAEEEWEGIDELRIRIALHAGPADYRAGDYFGPTVNRLARLLGTAWGGQIILTPQVLRACEIPEGAALNDLGVHLLKDLTEPQQVYGLVHEDLPLKEFPALRSLSSKPNNLPSQATPIVGREEELAEIEKLLAKPECRLLSLVAPGGMGKTRLGLQVAAEHLDDFQHGVFFVPLAGVTSPDNLPGAISNALKLSFYGAEDLESQLHHYLHEKNLLLLLDNFEHLVDGADFVSDILANAPQVKIVVTSRKRLMLNVEWVFDVPGLAVPSDGLLNSPEAYGSIDLFLQSARRNIPHFKPSTEDLHAIIRLCRLVDGMPLALELAAAWVNTLSCQEIVAELEKDLELLATDMQDIPARQRSIDAVFEHSWNDLSAEEKAVFSKLSVFRGGFDRNAAKNVAMSNVRILSGLVNKSLLNRDNSGRFNVHELLRQYSAAKLEAIERESEATKERHAQYFSDFLHRFEESIIQGAISALTEKIDAELDNILIAWRWAVEHKKLKFVENSMRAMFWFFEAKAWYSEGEELFKSAASALHSRKKLPGQDPDLLQFVWANMVLRRAWFLSRLSRFSEARDLMLDEVKLNIPEADLEASWVVGGVEINVHYGMGDFEAAWERLKQYDELYEHEYQYSKNWPWSKAQTYANLGRVAGALGNYSEARDLLQEGVQILRPLGDEIGVILYLHTLGGVERILGNRTEARRLFQEEYDLAEDHNYVMGKALALSDLGELAYEEGQYEPAKENFDLSRNLSEEIGDRRGAALALTNLGRVSIALGEYEQARDLYEQGLEITRQAGNRRGMAITLNRLSEAYRLMGELDRADDLCSQSRDVCEQLGYRKGAVLASITSGNIALDRDKCVLAREIFENSLEESNSIGFLRGIVGSLAGIGRANYGTGDYQLSQEYLQESLSLAGDGRLPRTTLTALVYLAETLAAVSEFVQAIELFGFVANHTLADQYTKDRAREKLKELRDKVDPSEFERHVNQGCARSLEEVLELQANSS